MLHFMLRALAFFVAFIVFGAAIGAIGFAAPGDFGGAVTGGFMGAVVGAVVGLPGASARSTHKKIPGLLPGFLVQ